MCLTHGSSDEEFRPLKWIIVYPPYSLHSVLDGDITFTLGVIYKVRAIA